MLATSEAAIAAALDPASPKVDAHTLTLVSPMRADTEAPRPATSATSQRDDNAAAISSAAASPHQAAVIQRGDMP